MEETTIKYPNIRVDLVGTDGNAYMIIGVVSRALTKAGVPRTEIAKFQTEAMAGDYNHLLQTCMRWVNC